MATISEDRAATASERAYDTVRQLILDGTLAPGTQIREEEVATLSGVSRTPARDALRRLEADLFIHRNESQRSFVSSWSAEDIEELFTLRAMLEAHAVRRAAANMNSERLAALAACNERLAASLSGAAPDIQMFLLENALFHRMIVEASGSERVAGMLAKLVLLPIVQQTARGFDRAQLEHSLADHREITAAFEAGDAEWAAAIMGGHIRRAYHARRAAAVARDGD